MPAETTRIVSAGHFDILYYFDRVYWSAETTRVVSADCFITILNNPCMIFIKSDLLKRFESSQQITYYLLLLLLLLFPIIYYISHMPAETTRIVSAGLHDI